MNYAEIPDIIYQAHGRLSGYGWAYVGDWTTDLDEAIDDACVYDDWRIWRIDVTNGRPAHIQDITKDAREQRNAFLRSQGRPELGEVA